ncbi:MAG: DEAD/DEAH box helicase, partial [Candidatus Poribacteria bacterium]
ETPVPFNRLPLIEFPFTEQSVRRRFEEMIEGNNLRRREAQLKMVEAVSRALKENRFMAIEAPTGTGKTFAYLVPSVLWARSCGETVVISTYTRLLQDQMSGDLEKLWESLGVSFRHQALKGMANYVCLERMAALYAQTDRITRFRGTICLAICGVLVVRDKRRDAR